MGGRGGVSTAIAMAAAAIVALALVALAAYGGIQSMQAARNVQEREAAEAKARLTERLTLIYWAPDGRAWIANDGPTTVTIVRAWVDGNPIPVEAVLEPGEIKVLHLGPPSSSLALETSTGAIHILREVDGYEEG